MKKTTRTPATVLPVYERAVARYPQLKTVPDAKNFCRQLTYLAAVPSITTMEYLKIAEVAAGEEWRWEE